jgi:hypothetical protein
MFVLKPEVFSGITPCRLINIYQSSRLNNSECFSLWTTDLIKTAGNETNIVSTIGFCQYGNASSGHKKAKELYDYVSYYQFRKKKAKELYDYVS